MTSFKTTLRAVLVVALGSGLSACDLEGLGDGNGLKSLKVVRISALVDTTKDESYKCFADQLQLQGEFDSGGIGDYTDRAVWTSSNPDVVTVSNGDVPLDGDTSTPLEEGEPVYGYGTILPKRKTETGEKVTITASFVGLSASYDVTVVETDLSKLKISDSSLTLAPETGRVLSVTTEIDGKTIDLGSLNRVRWSFEGEDDSDETPDEDPVAAIGAINGAVVGNKVGGPLIAQALFPLCKNVDGSVLRRTSEVNVLVPQQIVLTREYVDAPAGELLVGTSELMSSVAKFANGDTQDLTGILVLTSTAPTVISTNAALSRQFVKALIAGTSALTAKYGGDDKNDDPDDTDPPEVVSAPLTLNAVAGTLQSIDIEPVDRTVNAASATVYLAEGNFLVSGQERTQSLTRDLRWTVRNPGTEDTEADKKKILFLANVLTTGAASGNYVVKATFGTGDTAFSGTTGVCVRPIDDEDTEVDESAGICPDNPDED